MKSTVLALAVTILMTGQLCADTEREHVGAWSAATNGLQARLVLVERPRHFGTRWLVPYLELRNVRDAVNHIEVQCDDHHLKVELADVDGKLISDQCSLVRSGPAPDLGTVILPFDSSMRISLECKGWGISTDAAAMVPTASAAWVIQESENGHVYLRATLTGEKPAAPPYWKTWYGRITTPLLKIAWR